MVRSRLLLVGTAAGAGFWLGSRSLLHRQAARARHVIGKELGEAAPTADRTWKKSYGDRLELLVLDDSIAAGLGADQPDHTPGAQLAKALGRTARSGCAPGPSWVRRARCWLRRTRHCPRRTGRTWRS